MLKQFKRKFPIALIVLVIFILTSYVNVFAYAVTEEVSSISAEQQFFLGIKNSIMPDTQLANSSQLDINKPYELNYNVKFGDSSMLNAVYSDVKDLSYEFDSKIDPVMAAASFSGNVRLAAKDLLTYGLYADNDILAFRSKELYSKSITVNNNNLSSVFDKLGASFPTDKVDLSSSPLAMSPEMNQRIEAMILKYKDVLIGHLDSSMFQSVEDTRTINGISQTGSKVTMQLTGAQFVSILKTLINEAANDTELKTLLKDIFNDYLSSTLVNGNQALDTDIDEFINELSSYVNMYSHQIESFITNLKAELFIVDGIVLQGNIDLDISAELTTLNITAGATASDQGYDFTLNTNIIQKDINGFEQNLEIDTQGSIKNISGVDKFTASDNDIKLEDMTYAEFNDILNKMGENVSFIFYNNYEFSELGNIMYNVMNPVAPQAFPDVTMDSHPWAYNEINELAYKGIINGDQSGRFNPDSSISRAELAKILVYMYGLQRNGSESKFTDVTNDKWYYDVVCAAYDNGIIKGKTDTAFEPNASITRQDLSIMIVRTAQLKLGMSLVDQDTAGWVLDSFSDKAQISEYAYLYVATAEYNGLINGYYDGWSATFKPLNNATRAEAAVIISRIDDPMRG